MIRRFRPSDALATRAVFVTAVRQGAAPRYTAAELDDWLPDPSLAGDLCPPDWGPWLDGHIAFVAEEAEGVAGFMMLEASGYLNMAFVLPARMGTGLADQLYAAILDEARRLGLRQLQVLASRHAQSFFTRHGWRLAPEVTAIEGLDPRQGPGENPVNRAMALDGPGRS